MNDNSHLFVWRCAKCTNHFASINQVKGVLKQEKKCPKCKSLNILTLSDKEIIIHCKLFDSNVNGYTDEFQNSYPYP